MLLALLLENPLATASENQKVLQSPLCDTEIIENGYRRLRCPRYSFEADREVVGKLNTRKRALKMLGIKADPGEP
jgi:hypothetical protein